MLHLTPAELEELGSRVWELVGGYAGGPRAGTRPILAAFFAHPKAEEGA